VNRGPQRRLSVEISGQCIHSDYEHRKERNILGIIEGSWLCPGKHRDLTVVGSKKSVVSDILQQTIKIYDSYIEEHDGQLTVIDKGKKEIKMEFKEPLRLELLDFIQSIKTGFKKC